MLVLTRHKEEKVVITTAAGERITVMVMGLDRGRVRLGFDASKDVTVHRKEVQDAIDRKAAAEDSSGMAS